MKFLTYLSTYLFAITSALTVVLSSSMASALTSEEIDAMASQTTVVIAPVAEEDIQDRETFNKSGGSGVLIAKQGNTYYVLTAFHNFRAESENYGIRTWDGKVHLMNKDILSLGEYVNRRSELMGRTVDIKTIKRFDLAIVKFDCSKEYHTASIKTSGQVVQGQTLFISGWPAPDDQNPQRVRKFRDGYLSLVNSKPDPYGGYSLLYSNQTSQGISGGPVFDQDGWLVGIHVRGVAQPGFYCIDQSLNESNSCGIQVIHFLETPEAEILRAKDIGSFRLAMIN